MLLRQLTTLVIAVTLTLACGSATPGATPAADLTSTAGARATVTPLATATAQLTAVSRPKVAWDERGLPVGLKGPLIVLREGGADLVVVTAGAEFVPPHFTLLGVIEPP